MKFIFPFLLLSAFIYGQSSLQKAQDYLDRSDYRNAVPLYEKITKEAKLNQNLDLQVTAQNGLADCYIDLGATYKAMAILKQNVILLNKVTTKNYLLLAKTHQLLAICYDKLYLTEDYLAECHTFYRYYKKTAPEKEIYKALYFAYIGRYYNMRFLIDKAFHYTSRALKIYHKHKKEHLVDDYIFYNAHMFTIRNYKESLENKFKYLDSLQYFIHKRYPYDNLKKSRLFVSVAALNLDLASNNLFNTDKIDYKTGNLNANKAIALYSKGIAINNKLAGYYYEPSSHLNSLRGLMYFYKKDYAKALENYDEGIKRLIIQSDLEKSNYNYNYNNNAALLGLLNWKAWCLDEMYIQKKDTKLLYEIEKNLLLAEKIWQEYTNNNIKNIKQYHTNIYYNSPHNNLVKNYYKLVLVTGNKKFIDLYYEYDQKSKYTALLETLYKEKEKNISVKNNFTSNTLYISLENLFLKINDKIPQVHSKKQFEKEAKKELTLYNESNPNLFKKNILSLTEVQKKLNENDVILSYNFTGNQNNYRVLVFMISKYRIKIITLNNENDLQIDNLKVNNILENLQQNLISEYKSAAYDYYNTYFKPIEKYFPKSITHIQIIPNANIANLPFDILLSDKTASNDFNQLPYLAKKYEFSYGMSSSIADIIDQNATKSDVFSVFSPSFYTKDLAKLSKTNKESKVLANSFNAQLFQGTEATKKSFLNHIKNNRMVALLSHGSASDDELESNKGIYLSDGFLSLDEVYNLNANCDFLLLGTCESGVGYKSREGNINLARAFTAIGVKSMMLASWKIDEKSSLQIISSFLKYLDAGYTKSAALQKAKLDYLATASPRMANPLYWAGLNITGNNETIRLQQHNYWWWCFGILSVFIGVVLITYYKFYSKK
jgi:CHAT domain-containing protein